MWRLYEEAVTAAKALKEAMEKPAPPRPLPRWLRDAHADPRVAASPARLAILTALLTAWDGDPDALARRAWEMVVEHVPTPPRKATARATEAEPRSRTAEAKGTAA
ncbi:hypothetical protein [Limnoglobus roseus]|uniref:Uncharacterized protein n=1 Tax=Limnoglobus roseus TaxID=2598579 RepID=A0A5C1AIF0_9BACT|nr:hypothetical protein [Limnoglobus roseus]QEL16904.1 hypothetical protein PX52LOC_03879 [Limnoglobus roseus]